MLIVKVKRINSNIKIMVLVDEPIRLTFWNMVLDESTTKPISAESVLDKVYTLLVQENELV
jgi:hypothetical protein